MSRLFYKSYKYFFLQSHADPHNLHKKNFPIKIPELCSTKHNSNFCNYKYVTNITKTKHLINHGALVQFWQFVSYFFNSNNLSNDFSVPMFFQSNLSTIFNSISKLIEGTLLMLTLQHELSHLNLVAHSMFL